MMMNTDPNSNFTHSIWDFDIGESDSTEQLDVNTTVDMQPQSSSCSSSSSNSGGSSSLTPSNYTNNHHHHHHLTTNPNNLNANYSFHFINADPIINKSEEFNSILFPN